MGVSGMGWGVGGGDARGRGSARGTVFKLPSPPYAHAMPEHRHSQHCSEEGCPTHHLTPTSSSCYPHYYPPTHTTPHDTKSHHIPSRTVFCPCPSPHPAWQVDEFAGWLTGKVKEQEGKAAHEEPAFGSEEVASTLERVKKVGGLVCVCVWGGGWFGKRGRVEVGYRNALAPPRSQNVSLSSYADPGPSTPPHLALPRQAFNRLNNKKKPKPPPAPPAPANATEGAPGNTTEGEGAAPPESGQGEAGGKGQAEGAKEGAQGEGWDGWAGQAGGCRWPGRGRPGAAGSRVCAPMELAPGRCAAATAPRRAHV